MESNMVNYQKRYLAMSWNAISSFMFACKAWNCSVFPYSRQSQSDTRSDTLAIFFWYINPHKSILSQETKKKGNQGPKDAKKQELKAQMAMNTDNYNSI